MGMHYWNIEYSKLYQAACFVYMVVMGVGATCKPAVKRVKKK